MVAERWTNLFSVNLKTNIHPFLANCFSPVNDSLLYINVQVSAWGTYLKFCFFRRGGGGLRQGLSTSNLCHTQQILLVKQAPPPSSLFFTANIKMDRIPTKIKWKIHAFLTLYLKVLLIRICKIQTPDLLFLVVFISFNIRRYHFFANF